MISLCVSVIATYIRFNHTDAQCRDRGHPKYRNIKPQSHFPCAGPVPHQPHCPPHHAFQAIQQQHQQDNQPILVMLEADTDFPGTFVLDSGARPTYIPHPPCMQPLTKTLRTQTASQQQTTCTYSGTMRLKIAKNRTQYTHAVVNKHIQHNVLSVHDMASRCGLVAFTATQV